MTLLWSCGHQQIPELLTPVSVSLLPLCAKEISEVLSKRLVELLVGLRSPKQLLRLKRWRQAGEGRSEARQEVHHQSRGAAKGHMVGVTDT